MSFPARNALTYVCGYLIKKCLQKHCCNICFNYANNQNQVDQSFLFAIFKAYRNNENTIFGNLNVPPDQFYNYINNLDSIFIDEFPIIAVKTNLGKELRNAMDNIPFEHPCQEFNYDFLKDLYIRMRIFHTLKTLNKNLLSAPRKNCKIDILSHL